MTETDPKAADPKAAAQKTLDQSKGPGAHQPRTLDQIQADIEARKARENPRIDPLTGNLQKPNVVQPEKTAAVQQKVADDRNAHNEAGQAVLNEKAEREAEIAHSRKPRNPHIGKQRDVNTPIIDPVTGAKTWPA